MIECLLSHFCSQTPVMAKYDDCHIVSTCLESTLKVVALKLKLKYPFIKSERLFNILVSMFLAKSPGEALGMAMLVCRSIPLVQNEKYLNNYSMDCHEIL